MQRFRCSGARVCDFSATVLSRGCSRKGLLPDTLRSCAKPASFITFQNDRPAGQACHGLTVGRHLARRVVLTGVFNAHYWWHEPCQTCKACQSGKQVLETDMACQGPL